MSTLALFIFGIAVFTLTVYGVVMAGGLVLTKRTLDEEDPDGATVDRRTDVAGLPVDAKF